MNNQALDYTVDDEIEAYAAEENARCKKSCKRFIQNWVYIEDKDQATGDAGVAIKFILWPLQIKAMAAILLNRLLIILKARQLGLTWLVLSYAVWRMLFNPGYTVIALSKTEDDAKELVRRVKFILEHLPEWMTREKKQGQGFSGPVWSATTELLTIYHPGQEPSTFKSMTSAPGSGRSFTANLLMLDEWAFQQWAEQIWSAAYPTINRPTGGQCIGLSTNKRGSLFETIWKNSVKGLNSFARIFIPWWADPRRTRGWYEKSKTDLPNSWMQEYPSTAEEALSAGEGTAFPEFSAEIHVCKPFKIPAWWRRWRSNDPGYADPFCWHWFAVSDDGIVYIYREYTRDEKDPRVTYSGQAEEVVKLSVVGGEVGQPELDKDETPIQEQVGFTVVGRDAWNKLGRALSSPNATSEGKSIIDCYLEVGFGGCIPPPTDQQTARIIRKAVFHEYLRPFVDEKTGRTIAKVQIFSTCTRLIEAMPNLVVDEKDNEKVALDPHIYTNPYDSAGYGLVTWHVKHSKPPEPEKGPIAKHKDKLAKRHSMYRRQAMMR